MHKLLLLLGLCTIGAFAQTWSFSCTNNRGTTVNNPVIGKRVCICLKTSQTAKLKNTNGGDMKLFSTTDCTGNYVQLAKGKTQNNAQWVNSASVGQSGIPSAGPFNCDPCVTKND
ncbi:hypothetical protein BGZ51_004753 [Haplosporangium sp. Z 767]|nr:hypothetical protein BGZ50_007814 [Haplosporangium sp. Z 11]KAF9182417.1 hypothetical protein BGZ51_004753 [Haplosporangium sp. Z 767]